MWFAEQTGNRIGRIPVVPTAVRHCRHGRWRDFPQFTSQRACIRYLTRHRSNG